MLPARRRDDPVTTLRREMDRIFDRAFFGGEELGPGLGLVAQYPADLCEDEKSVYIDAEVPGFKKEEIQLNYDRGVLRMTAEHKEEKKGKGEPQQIERRYQRIERSFTLPDEVDISKAEASVEDGVLHVTLPKVEERKPARIEIR